MTYYKPNGKVDHVTTYINDNYEWLLPTVVIIATIVVGIVEAL